MWQHRTDGVLGLLVIVIAFLGLTGSALTWTLAITGLVIAILGFTGNYERSDDMHRIAH